MFSSARVATLLAYTCFRTSGICLNQRVTRSPKSKIPLWLWVMAPGDQPGTTDTEWKVLPPANTVDWLGEHGAMTWVAGLRSWVGDHRH